MARKGKKKERKKDAKHGYSRKVSMSEYMFRPEGVKEKSQKLHWLLSFAKSDPRWMIMRYFQNTVLQIESNQNKALMMFKPKALKGDIGCRRPAAFSVWRPTSLDAIKLMMMGKGTGKGLDIKGKSAKCGKLSGFVPFVQIHNNDEDKKKIGTIPPNARLTIFYKSANLRDKAEDVLNLTLLKMSRDISFANYILLTKDADCEAYEEALKTMSCKMKDPTINQINDYGPEYWGLDMPERLFWRCYIMEGNCTREERSPMDTGRASEPEYFNMNLTATRSEEIRCNEKQNSRRPRPVVFQTSTGNPVDPMTLVVAYEERNSVYPVVSDFDPFLIGTRGVQYNKPIKPEQIDVLKWSLQIIENILANESRPKYWHTCWLEELKKDGFHPKIPQFGFGDPTSYGIIEKAVNVIPGAVRHGAESFNYYFPQRLDDKFLVISENITHKYQYMDKDQLKTFLLEQVQLGFTFPLNLKWVICDPGWLEIWYALLCSNHPHVKESLDIWYPPESGVREQTIRISETYPQGFVTTDNEPHSESTESMDLALLQLKRHFILKRAKKKLRVVISWIKTSNVSSNRRLSTMATQVSGLSSLSGSMTKYHEFESFKSIESEDYSEEALDICWLIREGAVLKPDIAKALESKLNVLNRKEAKLNYMEADLLHKSNTIAKQETEIEILRSVKNKEKELKIAFAKLKAKESYLMKLIKEFESKKGNKNGQNGTKNGNSLSSFMHKEIYLQQLEAELMSRQEDLNNREDKIKSKEFSLKEREGANAKSKKHLTQLSRVSSSDSLDSSNSTLSIPIEETAKVLSDAGQASKIPLPTTDENHKEKGSGFWHINKSVNILKFVSKIGRRRSKRDIAHNLPMASSFNMSRFKNRKKTGKKTRSLKASPVADSNE